MLFINNKILELHYIIIFYYLKKEKIHSKKYHYLIQT